jgi:hypothetical protein
MGVPITPPPAMRHGPHRYTPFRSVALAHREARGEERGAQERNVVGPSSGLPLPGSPSTERIQGNPGTNLSSRRCAPDDKGATDGRVNRGDVEVELSLVARRGPKCRSSGHPASWNRMSPRLT